MHLITLTTDFGAQDWFVGTMKGVIAGINPNANVVDLTHEVPPGNIRAGAFALAASCRFFPKGTVHVVVVDPGVGGAREAIAVQTANYLFVAPDNGVLSFALEKEKIKSVHRLENEIYFLQPLSHTFHGRDIFAPVAAHLSRRVAMQKLGPAQKDFIRLKWPESRATPACIDGEVVYVDRFGNAITNIENTSLESRGAYEVFAGRKKICRTDAFYQSVPAGKAVAVPGSSGFLEIAVNGGSAEQAFGFAVGKPVTLRRLGRKP